MDNIRWVRRCTLLTALCLLQVLQPAQVVQAQTEPPPNFCLKNPCKNGGECVEGSVTYNCECSGPWTGRNCTIFSPCSALDCQNRGHCVVDPPEPGSTPVARCFCVRGTYGDLCQFDEDECQTGNGGCLNGGTCVDIPYSFRCDCPPNTSGQYCEIGVNGTYVNPCASNPCQNGASCLGNQPWRVQCQCQPGWGGPFCGEVSCTTPNIYAYDYEDEGGYRPDVENINYAQYAYQVSEDYCLFGGECVLAGPTSTPTCRCAKGYSGPRCFYRKTGVTSMVPTMGPQSGGTEVTITGYSLNYTRQPIVFFDTNGQSPKFKNNTVMIFETLPADDIDIPLNVTIKWFQDGGFYDVQQDFTYKVDPTITEVKPTQSIISGGVLLTVTGTGLDVVGKPILQITIVYQATPVHVFDSLCTVKNSTTMFCPTPKLEILNEDGEFDLGILPTVLPTIPTFIEPQRRRRRRHISEKPGDGVYSRDAMINSLWSMLFPTLQRNRRQADMGEVKDFRINNETVEFRIGFKLDGVPTYTNLTEVLPQYSQLTVYVDPLVTPWIQQQVVMVDSRILEVAGERLRTGIQATDYTMYIGQSECIRLEVFDNKLICTAPPDQPQPHTDDGSGGIIVARVKIGMFKDPFIVGEVNYRMSFFDNPHAKWGVIGAGIVVVLIIIIGIAICIARKTTAE